MENQITSNLNLLLADYRKYKNEGIRLINNSEFEKGLSFLAYCTRIAWKYPIIENYVDDELEAELERFVKTEFSSILGTVSNKKKIVFYNGQIVDRGALTEQYLNYLIDHDFNVLFIVSKKEYTILGKSILEKINLQEQVELFIPTKDGFIEVIQETRDKIKEFEPSIAFLHFLPNDIIGFCSFVNTQGITRYYINHNDHTFWLGKSCSDYIIEFRDFGVNVSFRHRAIPADKIFILPFYPINDLNEFEGFPLNLEGKIIGVSGGNLYKYTCDPRLEYFHWIYKLLLEFDDFVFLLCGWGDDELIKSFIFNNKIENRFIYLGRRNDFYELVGKCSIMFESFPIKGGLTPLFAIEQNVPVIGISNHANASGSLEELIGIKNYQQPVNFIEFYEEAAKLISSNLYREKLVSIQKKNYFNKKDFNKGLNEILSTNKRMIKTDEIKDIPLDFNAQLQTYLNLVASLEIDLIFEKIRILNKFINFCDRIFFTQKIFCHKEIKPRTKVSLILKLYNIKK